MRGHRRTSSGERSARDRDSTGSSQRLSTYDNVTSSSSMGSVPSVASTPWSTSSCEISGPDSASSEPSSNHNSGSSSGAGAESDSQKEEDQGGDGGTGAERRGSVDQEDSCEAMEVCGNSAACSENGNGVVASVVIPSIYTSEDGDGGSPSLGSLVEGLRDELRSQKGAYEVRIKK